MKKLIIAACVLLAGTATFAQEAKIYNDVNVEKRTVTGFKGVKVSQGIELVLSQGAVESVAVSAFSNEHRDRIKTVVEGDVLRIYYDGDKSGRWTWNKKNYLRAYVSAVTLQSVEASSGAAVKVDGTIQTNDLMVQLSSGSLLTGSFKAESMKIEQGSGSTARVSGTANSLKVRVNSGAGFYGYDLTVTNCNANASSGARAEISASKELEASASSGGSIRYQGGCVIRNLSTSSGGSVKNKSK